MATSAAPLVLGGGMAGIAAAVSLAEQGLRPILVESRPYLGGRTRSFIHEGTGDEIDNGQHLMMGCYRATFRLLTMLGTRDLVKLQPALRVEFRDTDGSFDLLAAPSTPPAPLNVLLGMIGLRRLSRRERFALLRLGISIAIAPPSPSETVHDYLERLGQSRRLQERLWHPIVIATLNTPPESASALLFGTVMRKAFLGRGNDSQLAFPLGGLSRLIAPARGHIEGRGGKVMVGEPIVAIEREGKVYRVHLKDGSTLASERVISSLPPRALKPLLRDPALLEALLPERIDISYSPIVSLYLWFDRPLDELPEFSALIGTSVQWMFNKRKLGSPSNSRFPGLLSCTISAAFEESAADSAQVIARAERELRDAFPELRGATLLDALVVKEKHATFAATPAVAAQRPGPRTSMPGFQLAGDWTATGLPATIEGAVVSGLAAAVQCVKLKV